MREEDIFQVASTNYPRLLKYVYTSVHAAGRRFFEANLRVIEANLAEKRSAFYFHFLSVKRSSLIAPSFYGPSREWNIFSRTRGGNRLKVRAFG